MWMVSVDVLDPLVNDAFGEMMKNAGPELLVLLVRRGQGAGNN